MPRLYHENIMCDFSVTDARGTIHPEDMLLFGAIKKISTKRVFKDFVTKVDFGANVLIVFPIGAT